MAQGKAEDAGGLSPVKDDNAAMGRLNPQTFDGNFASCSKPKGGVLSMAGFQIEELSREIMEKMNLKEYSYREVEQIYNMVRARHAHKQKGLRRAAVVLVIACGGVFALTVLAGPGIPPDLLKIMAGVLGMAMAFGLAVGWYAANKMTNQFLKALDLGYPELEEKFGRDTFKT